MKKNLLSLGVILFFVCNSYSSIYKLKIFNNTTTDIKAYIEYTAPGVCAQDEILVAAGKTKIINNSLCCPEKFSITGTKGLLKWETKSIWTDLCNHNFTINQVGVDPKFSISDEKW